MVAKIRDEDNEILFLHQASIPVRHNAWTELKKYSIICIRNDVVKSEFVKSTYFKKEPSLMRKLLFCIPYFFSFVLMITHPCDHIDRTVRPAYSCSNQSLYRELRFLHSYIGDV